MPIKVEAITAGHASRHTPGLGTLLADAIHHGASLGFLAPLTTNTAQRYWDGVLDEVVQNQRQLWIATADEKLVGTVQLTPCHKENGWNRAEVQKLVVHTAWRNRGVARQLMAALEKHAHQTGRKLVYLDTEVGSAAEKFYACQGYQKAGEIPDFACSPDGTLRGTAIYYKQLMEHTWLSQG
ncbi:GNAT family N-acetyltransferase [Chitinimonas sp. PSY-7]|uniref:GNAT family N-acetyltransferase n=1 Tax=Chitinimonas sp. PSY-7 TaxID=3459088 RepID=UPI00404035F9